MMMSRVLHGFDAALSSFLLSPMCLASPFYTTLGAACRATPRILIAGDSIHATSLGRFWLQWTRTRECVEIMSARNKKATAHAACAAFSTYVDTSTTQISNSKPSGFTLSTDRERRSQCLWTKGAELKHDVIRLRSLVNVQSKTPIAGKGARPMEPRPSRSRHKEGEEWPEAVRSPRLRKQFSPVGKLPHAYCGPCWN